MAKNIDYYASVISGTTRVVGESQNDWSTVRLGSYIKFQGDPTYFTVSNKKEYLFISNFETEGGKILKMEKEFGIDLIRNDVITITYKEQELLNVSKIIEGGKGYAMDDVLQVVGGSHSIDTQSNCPTPTLLKVQSVDNEGSIESLSIQERGRYLDAPNEEAVLINGNGNHAKIKAQWVESHQRQIIEREIAKVGGTEDKLDVILNYALPTGVKKGKASVKKWELHISSPYSCVGKIDAICNITRDFTPNFKLPLMSSNQHPWLLNQEVAHNETVSRVDLLLKQLEDRIKKLED